MMCPSSEVRRRLEIPADGVAGPIGVMMCAVPCAVLPRTYRYTKRGESPGRVPCDDTDELVRTRCGHLLSGGSQVRTLPGAPREQGFLE